MTAAPHIYIESDLAFGQTLVEWRREQVTHRRAEKRRRRPFRLPSLRLRLAH